MNIKDFLSMIRSMTAYGRAKMEFECGSFMCEVWSVNRKHLDIKCFLPKELSRFEADIRQWLSPHIGRGQVTVKASVHWSGKPPVNLRCNAELAKNYLALREELSSSLKRVHDQARDIDWVLKQEGVIEKEESVEDEEALRRNLEEVLQKAVIRFTEMKEREGKALFADLMERLKNLAEKVNEVDRVAPDVVPRYREKLLKRLEELNVDIATSEEMIAREVAFVADKADIQEEVTRFRSHLSQLEGLFKKQGGQIGKEADFLVQELVREANTIGSKTSELKISQTVIAMKTEIERMREQLQNVE